MSNDRVPYQRGAIEFHATTNKYYFRYRDADRRRRSVLLGNAEQLSSAAKLNRAADEMRTKVNADLRTIPTEGMLMSELVEMYRTQGMPQRLSTARGYTSKLNNHILPRWGQVPVSKVMNSAYEVSLWLKEKTCSPKTKSHIRGLLSILLEYAMLRGVVPVGRNPISLVRVEGASKRKREPNVLTHAQFAKLLSELREPFRTMTLLAGSLGLRCSEILGLRWKNIDFDARLINLRQGVVSGQEGELKTERSKSILPLHPDLAEAIGRWKKQASFTHDEDWVFASPFSWGRKPYHGWSAQNQILSPAAVRAGLGRVGWHDLRHSYRSWLDATGAPIGVQKDLMRHANISTTMNIYGRALPQAQRDANSNVVVMLKQAVGASL
jgi:integrase